MRLTLRFAAAALPLCAMPLCTLLATPLSAKPADYARSIADTQRNEANRKLDADRMPAEVLDFAGVTQGQVIADFQAGGGYYTELLSRAVGPRGRVYAMVNSGFFKADAWAPITQARPNILLLSAPGNALQLAPASVDMIFTHLVFHDLYLGTNRAGEPLPDPQSILANWFAAVKPGGHVIIADHVGPAGDTTTIAKRLHRIDPEAAKAEMLRAGFVLDGESAVLHRSDDSHEVGPFDASLRGHTDRFLLKFRRP
jgi:predicted methyltransferase